jgi:LysM repeat protein
MKKFVLLIAACWILLGDINAQKEKALAYVAMYKNIAIAEMIYSGVPAAITLAQGILESQYGESDLCRLSNNHFGIKCKEEWTGDKVFHDDDKKNECFRSYPDAAASYRDHSDFLKNRPYYADLFKLDPTDYQAWAYGLKKAGYATEKDYPQQLMKVINEYDLNQYTLLALQQQSSGANGDMTAKTKELSSGKNTDGNGTLVKYVQPASVSEEKEEVEVYTKEAPVQKPDSFKTVKTDYPEGVFSINHTKVVYAQKGVSILSLANQYDISLSKLLEFNEMTNADVLDAATLIFLEKKMKKGDKDFHVVKDNESLYDICQKEGVRMDCVLEYNGLRRNMQPLTGEKIYLRSVAPVVPKAIFAVVMGNDSFSK